MSDKEKEFRKFDIKNKKVLEDKDEHSVEDLAERYANKYVGYFHELSTFFRNIWQQARQGYEDGYKDALDKANESAAEWKDKCLEKVEMLEDANEQIKKLESMLEKVRSLDTKILVEEKGEKISYREQLFKANEKIRELEAQLKAADSLMIARGVQYREDMAALVEALEKIRAVNAEMGCECGADDDWPNEPIYMCDTHRSLEIIGKALKTHREKYGYGVCPHCKKGKIVAIRGTEPYDNNHRTCENCLSTFNLDREKYGE